MSERRRASLTAQRKDALPAAGRSRRRVIPQQPPAGPQLPVAKPQQAVLGARPVALRPDYWLLVIVLCLLSFGLLMVYSASVVTGYMTHGNQFHYLGRQSLWALLGAAAMLVTMRVDYHRWGSLALPALLVSIGMLAYVIVPGLGQEAYGASRWIPLGPVTFQPSEFAKLALIIYMARWLARKEEQVSDFALGFLPFCVLLAMVVALLHLQRDLGTTGVAALTAVAIFFAAGANLWQLALLGIVGSLAVVPLVAMAGYRLQRVAAFLDPWADPQRAGYHVVQALLALGGGGVTGVGLGMGRGKFMYLPFPHTDSIFAVIGEELGLIGTSAVIGLFLLLGYRGLRVAWHAPDTMGRLLATGVTCGIVFQALINVAVLTSSVPFTGITLPLISYGGSSLVVTLMSAGLLLNVSRYAVPDRDARRENDASPGLWRRYRWPHLSGTGRRQRASQHAS